MNKLFLIVMILSLAVMINAQTGYESVLRQIETNNTTLKTIRQQTNAQRIENRTDIFLENPEIELTQFWGLNDDSDTVTSFSVTQSFDFPTAYFLRKKISNIENDNAELSYMSQRREILLDAKEICIELVYTNILISELTQRLENAAFIASAYQTKLQQGETNILEFNNAQLNMISLQAEVSQTISDRSSLLLKLKQHNGGVDIVFDFDSYQHISIPTDFDEWYAQINKSNPELLSMRNQIQIDKRELRLNRAMGLPRFSIGYITERSRGESSDGVMVGMSVPLWESRNRIRGANAQLRATTSALRDGEIQIYHEYQNLYNRATSLQESNQIFRAALIEHDNEPLLLIALESGEISLIDYLREIEFYFELKNQFLEAERDLELMAAQFWTGE
jgi:outer membrane protein TolC